MVSPGAISPGDVADSRSLPGMPPLPAGKTTLLGGTVYKLDHVRDRIVLQVFGGQRMTVLFDERTRMFRDGKPASLDDLKNGERVYLDTTLDGTDVFARSIQVAG